MAKIFSELQNIIFVHKREYRMELEEAPSLNLLHNTLSNFVERHGLQKLGAVRSYYGLKLWFPTHFPL